MVKRPKFNILNNPLSLIGYPLFKVLVFFISFLAFLVIFFQRLIKKVRLNRSGLKISKLKIALLLGGPVKKQKRPSIVFPRINFRNLINIRGLVFLLTFGFLSGLLYYEFYFSLPNPHLLKNFPSKLTTQILDRNGKLLYKIYKDENRTLIDIDELPEHIKYAFLAAEDKDFYQHIGFSINGISRAIIKNFRKDRLEGGSTITQQLVKNTLLSPEKTISRKIKELVLALRVEQIFSKDEIFEMYLNQVGFGGPAYGIQEASRQYFNIDAKDLTLSQAAFLAGLPQAPSKYSPYGDHPELAKQRQRQVLQQMLNDGFISQDQLEQSLKEELVFGTSKIEIKAPHFVMYIKDLLTENLGENLVNYGGLIVTTTLDLDIQDKAQDIVTSEISQLNRYNVSNGAALVTNPANGEVLAMVGSIDYFNLNQDGQVNLTTSLRQPGSSIKPLNYALAFEKGLNPSSTIEDKPISFNVIGQGVWTPKNYDNRFHGTITLRQALASSYNIPSVILLTKNGINSFADFAEKMGISTWNNPSRYGLSMALGSLEVTMTDLSTAYSAFANDGQVTPLKSILSIQDINGKQLFLASCSPHQEPSSDDTAVNAEDKNCRTRQVMSKATAYQISDILSDNQARSPAFGSNSVLNIPKLKISVKTGTSNDLRDNWTIGYNKNYLVSTWVGNNNNQPMSNIASGITGASPIWSKIFKYLLEKDPNQDPVTLPDNMIKVPICILTGTLTCDGCPTRYEYFEKGKEPTVHCQPEVIDKILHPTPKSDSGTGPQIL